VSRRYRRPFRRVKGRAPSSSLDAGSLEVRFVIPLDAVLLEMLLDRPCSPLAAAAAAAALCSAATWRACLRSAALIAELEEDFRLAVAA
jgi:hypothetical protein